MKTIRNSKIIVVLIAPIIFFFLLSINQASALPINLIHEAQIESPILLPLTTTFTPLPTSTVTLTITTSPTVTTTPSPTNTITPLPAISLPTNIQVEGLISWKVLIQILVTGAVIGAVFAYLTRISALKLLSLRLDKLGIALGVEGFDRKESNKAGVSLNNINGSQVGDIAVGSTIDKSTNLRQFISNIDEKLEKSTDEINQKLGKLIGTDLDNMLSTLKEAATNKLKDKEEDESILKRIEDINCRMSDISAILENFRKDGEASKKVYLDLEKKYQSISELLSKLTEELEKRKNEKSTSKKPIRSLQVQRRNRNL